MKRMNSNTTYRINSSGHLALVEEYDPSTMVMKTLTSEMRLTPEQLTMLDEADKYPIVYEEDCPEITTQMAEAFRKAAKLRDQRKALAAYRASKSEFPFNPGP